ncbi:pre-peptidase C-terminal domain-containing protein [Leptolyngbya sp. GB1-A1]|uniref:cadherin-like domain-containing protein n=1 Tax=Leptolyngbya sp. GB1-A1 TaxID=2933908 RepID=UPI003298843A
MAQDSGNTLLSARSLNLATGPKTRRETIGGSSDPRDFFKFNLTSRSSLDLSLKKLRSNVDVSLLDSTRKVIASSRRADRLSESIKTTLDAGTFYIRLNTKEASTGYQLQVAATPIPGSGTPGGGTPGGGTPGGGTPGGGTPGGGTPGGGIPTNTAPTIGTNTALIVSRNGTGTIGRTNLFSSDTQQTADQLLYRVTSLPASGSLFLNGTPLGVGSAFTQTDIDTNKLTYKQNSAKDIPNAGRQISSDAFPQISGSNVVWGAKDSTGDTEIFFYNGITKAITQLSDNTVEDSAPKIFGSNVVWESGTGTDAEIYLYNGTSGATTRLSDNPLADTNARISDSFVVWQRRYPSGEHDIRYYRLSDGASGAVNNSITLNDIDPALSGSKLVFQRDNIAGASTNADDGIFYYDLATLGPTQTQLSVGNSAYTDRRAQISGSAVTWERRNSTESDILYDADVTTSGGVSSINVSADDDTNPLISGSKIVFQRSGTTGGTNDGIYLFTIGGAATRIIPPSTTTADVTSFDGNKVGYTNTSGGGFKAAVYDILAGNSQDLVGGAAVEGIPVVSGNNAAWIGGGSSALIDRLFFYDTSIVSDNFGFSVSDGLLTTNGTFNFTIG